MLIVVAIAIIALLGAAVGLQLAFGKNSGSALRTDGAPYSKEVLEAASASMKKTGKSLLAAATVVLLGCAAWYQLYYMSEAQVSARQEKRAASDARMQEIKLQRLVRGFVGANLKDPDSAQFRNQNGICGEVNAKNSFGAFTGYRRFIAKSDRMVILEGDGLVSPDEFAKLWIDVCD